MAAQRAHGYRPGDHVTGTVRANYFFGKPVDRAEFDQGHWAWMWSSSKPARRKGKTDATGEYRFDLPLSELLRRTPAEPGRGAAC